MSPCVSTQGWQLREWESNPVLDARLFHHLRCMAQGRSAIQGHRFVSFRTGSGIGMLSCIEFCGAVVDGLSRTPLGCGPIRERSASRPVANYQQANLGALFLCLVRDDHGLLRVPLEARMRGTWKARCKPCTRYVRQRQHATVGQATPIKVPCTCGASPDGQTYQHEAGVELRSILQTRRSAGASCSP